MIGKRFEERQGEDPLEDTASHMPLEPQQSRLGESTGLIRDTDLRQTEGLQLEGLDQQRQEVVPLVMAPATTPAPAAVPTLHVNPLFIAQIVRAGIEAMLGASALTIPIALAVQAAKADNVVTLVQIVKSMRELGCEPFLGEPDPEIAGRWLHTIEDTLDQIQVTEGLRVNCAAHLLFDRARSWWDTVRSRRCFVFYVKSSDGLHI